jgi:hypothetical protein
MGVIDDASVHRAGVAIAAIVTRYRANGPIVAFARNDTGARAAMTRPVGGVAGDIANALGKASHAARDGRPIRIL